MVVRLFNLTDWEYLKPGSILKLDGAEGRLVRIEFNVEAPTSLHLVQPDNKHVFLAVVMGLDVVEFRAPAEVHVVASSDGEVWYFTNHGQQITAETDGPTFTKLMTRAERNPELERIMWAAEQRARRREAQMAAEFDARLAAQAAQHASAPAAAQPSHDPETGEVIEDGGGQQNRGVAPVDTGSAEPAGGGDKGEASAPAAKPAGKAAKAGAGANGAG